MVSKQRYVEPGFIYHVLNRGALRQQLFAGDDDFQEFESLIQETLIRIPLSILTYEIMPNHWHFVVQPMDKEQLSSFFKLSLERTPSGSELREIQSVRGMCIKIASKASRSRATVICCRYVGMSSEMLGAQI